MFGLKNVTKIYKTKGNETVRALDGINITLKDKGLVFILGKSGSGKSTLLNVMGGLDSPNSGEIIVDGVSSLNFSQTDFDGYRNTYVGFVFQEYNILDEFTVGENIALSLRLQNMPCPKEKIEKLLKLVDLEGVSGRSPRTLSGGQKQRVAIARALIKDPKIIMADEPTGSLDSATGEQVFNTLKKLSKNKLVVVVSHDRDFATTYGDRIIELADGKVVSDVERVEENGDSVFKNVSTFEDSVIISDASRLSEEEAKKIIELIRKNGGETVIAFGGKKTEDVKKAINHTEQRSKGTFVKSKPLPTLTGENKKKNFVKSKLPLSHALKMGTSGFKSKPIRFAFTVFLSVIAFCLFGVMSTLMLYTPAYSVSRALQENNYRSVVMSKSYDYIERSITVRPDGKILEVQDVDSSGKALFGASEIEKLNKASSGLEFAGVFTLNNPSEEASTLRLARVSVDSSSSSYFSVRNVAGFSDCGEEYLERNGAELLYGSYPRERVSESLLEEVAVSEYIYELYKSGNALVKDYKSFLEEITIEVILEGETKLLQPTAIYRLSDLSRYNKLKYGEEMLSSEKAALVKELRETLEYSLDTVLFVAPDFYEANKTAIPEKSFSNLIYLTTEQITLGITQPESYVPSNRFYTESIIKYAPDRFSFFDVFGNEKNYQPNDSEVWVSKRAFDNYLDEVRAPEDLEDRTIYVKNKNGEIKEITLAGYFDVVGQSISEKTYVLTDNFLYSNATVKESEQKYAITNYSEPEDAKYNYVVTNSSNSISEVSFILEKRGVTFMEMENAVYDKLYGSDMISSLNSLKKIFMVAGVILGLLSALMLYNFISVSIAAKRKEMGILRAVGAGKRDIFRIFFTESIVLAIICFVIASIFAGLVGLIVNNVLYGIFEMHVIQYTFKNVLLICAISFVISLLATIFPVTKEAKKSPVESIRQL